MADPWDRLRVQAQFDLDEALQALGRLRMTYEEVATILARIATLSSLYNMSHVRKSTQPPENATDSTQ